MSARLIPGSTNPATAARVAAQRRAAPTVLSTRRNCLGQDRYGRVVDHPMEAHMADLPEFPVFPLAPRVRVRAA